LATAMPWALYPRKLIMAFPPFSQEREAHRRISPGRSLEKEIEGDRDQDEDEGQDQGLILRPAEMGFVPMHGGWAPYSPG
jgi:hypothetical protein